MTWALIILAAASILELFTWVGFIWQHRRYVASFCIVVSAIAVGLLVGYKFNAWTVLLLVVSGYRVVNLLRLIEGRMDPDYLFIVSRKTSLRLILGQLVIGGVWYLDVHLNVSLNLALACLGVAELGISFLLAYSLRRSMRTTRPFQLDKHYADRDLPSISVLIPARNETVDLEQCLTSLVSSTYPKLEIIVLDDCSQNKHTPEIIKGFAQAGVRFMAGKIPPEFWLAKNYAYKQLADQASGDILVFVGVDTRFSPETLTTLIETMLEKKKSTVSLMPVNKQPSRFNFMSCLVQPTRYGWELALPRRMLNRPPVLSTCWAIYANKLHDYGGFKAISRNSSPESYFAKKAINDHDGYSFIRSSGLMGLKSEKSLYEQRQTAIRTRYPQVHRRLELILMLSLGEILAFFTPIFSVIWGLVDLNWLVFSVGVVSLFWLSVTYASLCQLTYSKFLLKGVIVWPISALYDIWLLNYSMWLYEFREVVWKGRNICLPVMRFKSSNQEN